MADILIIGGGPAGGTAALFGSRIGRSVTVVSRGPMESAISRAPVIDNFPGVDHIPGTAFLENLKTQCLNSGVEWREEAASKVFVENRRKNVLGESGAIYTGKSLIIAAGTTPIKPSIIDLDRFWGRGVSVCAWCDGAFFRDKTVAVYGSGNTAYASVEVLSRIAKEVFLIGPKNRGTAFPAYRKMAQEQRNVRILSGVEILAAQGTDRLEALSLRRDGATEVLEADGLFIAVGQKPNSTLFRGLIDLDGLGFIPADGTGKTNVPGIFAAGDIVAGQFQQLVVACGSGANAALGAEAYVSAQWYED